MNFSFAFLHNTAEVDGPLDLATFSMGGGGSPSMFCECSASASSTLCTLDISFVDPRSYCILQSSLDRTRPYRMPLAIPQHVDVSMLTS